MPSPKGPPDNEADLDRFFALSLDLLCIAGLDGYFRRVNPSWTRVLGWSAEELLARPVTDFIHPDDVARTLRARAQLAKGMPVIGLETRYLCKDGSHRWLSWQCSPYREGSLMIGVARDITERRLADAVPLTTGGLDGAGLLAAGAALSFNNLLASLLLNLEMVRLVGPVSDEQLRHIDQGRDAVRAGQAFTRQLLAFTDGARASRRVLDLGSLLQETLRAVVAGPSLRVECDLAPGLWRIEGKEAQIRQVFRTLWAKSVASVMGEGTLILSARNVTLGADGGRRDGALNGDFVCITLTEEAPAGASASAPGAPDFAAANWPVSMSGPGLELSLCHAILRQHGGDLVTEPRVERGLKLRCYLPAARHLPQAEVVGRKALQGAGSPASAGGPPRVLVMDDEPWLREVMAQTLRQVGYLAEMAKDGDEAIARYRAAREAGRPFDVLLLDLTVHGGVGGCEVVRTLRMIDPRLKAVLMTGYDQDTVFWDHTRLGFDAALSKPFTVERLREALAKVLAR